MRLLLAAACCCALALAASAQPADTAATQPSQGRLTAAVSHAPPFAIKNPDGTWDGAAVELWRDLGRAEGFDAALVEVAHGDLLDAVTNGRADLALTTVASAEAEGRADFALPYYTATLGVAEPRGSGIGKVLGRLFSPTFFKIALGIAVLLLVVGTIAWLVERSENEDDFRQGLNGVWDGFYWAGVTMSTIGYGDKAPRTVGGQSLALVWMLVSMAVTAALTAALVSALGLKSGGSVDLPGDVRGKTVGVVEGTAAAEFLEAERVRVRRFPTTQAALQAMERDSVEVLVGSTPVLEHALNEAGLSRFKVSATKAEPQQWAFAVPAGSPLREQLSRAVLRHTDGPTWQATLDRYMPSSP
jgi:ABC-type amino acid transport substrate-binding protein